MPRFGKFIKGDHTKLISHGEVQELTYREKRLAYIDSSNIVIFEYDPTWELHRVFGPVTYQNRITEFLQEFFKYPATFAYRKGTVKPEIIKYTKDDNQLFCTPKILGNTTVFPIPD